MTDRADRAAVNLSRAYARAAVAHKIMGAFCRYWLAETDAERDQAERDHRQASAELDALPGLVSVRTGEPLRLPPDL